MRLEKINSGKGLTLCAICEKNRLPEWIKFIEKMTQEKPNEADKIIQFISALCDTPNLIYKNPQKYEKYTDEICCLKPTKSIRLLCFHDGRNLIIVTHGVTKKVRTDKKYQREIKRALEYKTRYFNEKP